MAADDTREGRDDHYDVTQHSNCDTVADCLVTAPVGISNVSAANWRDVSPK